MHALAKGLALEHADADMRANVVAPGPVDTGMLADRDDPTARVPLARMCQPEEVAVLFAFLASDEACSITGSVHLIDGGESIAR